MLRPQVKIRRPVTLLFRRNELVDVQTKYCTVFKQRVIDNIQISAVYAEVVADSALEFFMAASRWFTKALSNQATPIDCSVPG